MLQNTSLERSMGNALVNANSIEPIRSALKDASGGGIEKFILEMINAGKISTFNEVSYPHAVLCLVYVIR